MIQHVEGVVLAGADLDASPAQVERGRHSLARCVARVRTLEPPIDASLAPELASAVGAARGARAAIVGVHQALASAQAEATIVLGGARTALHYTSILALLALVPAAGGVAIVAAQSDDGPDPLFAVYRAR